MGLKLEQFNLKTREWEHKRKLEVTMASTKFGNGAFRDAFKGEEISECGKKI